MMDVQAARPGQERRWPLTANALVANSILLAGGTVALWALWRHLVRSGVIGEPRLASPVTWEGRAIVFAGLAALFFSALALRPRPRIVVARVTFSGIAVLYALELVLATTAIGPSSNVPFWLIERGSPGTRKEIAVVAARSGMSVDTRSRRELLDDTRRRGTEILPAVMLVDVLDGDAAAGSRKSTRAHDLLPLGGISNTLTLLCNQGQIVSYSSDEHGFRNPRGIWNSPRADLAAVGQSFAQGYCVPDGQGFVDLLRIHNPVTLNLGTSGQSSLLQLAAIKEYLPRYQPKTVLWIFAEGIDLPDLYDESMHPLSRRYLDPTFSQHLLGRQPEIDATLRRLVARLETRERELNPDVSRSSLVEQSLPILKLWNLRQKLEMVAGLSLDAPQARSNLEPTADLLSDALAQARTVVASWGGTLYFVYLPGWDRFRNGPRAAERERTKVLRMVNGLSIPAIDIEPAFHAQDDPLSLFPFRRFGHYNERGNRIVAATILRALYGP
jgi:hypothetical protein